MLEIEPPKYKFCPFCGERLQVRIEEEKERKFCPPCEWTYYPHVGSAAGAVIIKEGKVLMVKRRREPHKDTWMFPAGFADFGEHPLETVAREVQEETGLSVEKANFLEVVQSKSDPREPGHFVFFYEVVASEGKLKTDEEETQDIAWVDIKNPPEIGFESHKQIMKTLQERY
ncbi:MAG TPA: NUDIX hydrolase [Nevskiaceae bacterium]|nr:NUDIX hydrolase [Nevskiaceae bacterium]